MADKAHIATDKELAKMERHLSAIYDRASKDISTETKKFADGIKTRSDELLKAISEADTEEAKKAAENAYKRFYTVEVLHSKQYKKMAQSVADRLYQANKESSRYINTKTANIYTINYNQIGNGLGDDLQGYSFKPISEKEAEDYGEITRQAVDKKKDKAWNNKNIAKTVIAGAALLYSADRIFSNAAKSTTSKNHSSANRQASDMLTDAENKGRLDSMYRAYDEGFEVKKYWSAALDNRTRDTHIEYDSMEPVELDYEYSAGLKRPRDPDCPDPSEICNCRCRLLYNTGRQRSETRAAREGEVSGSYKKASSFKDTQTVNVPNMTYKEWMKWRSK